MWNLNFNNGNICVMFRLGFVRTYWCLNFWKCNAQKPALSLVHPTHGWLLQFPIMCTSYDWKLADTITDTHHTSHPITLSLGNFVFCDSIAIHAVCFDTLSVHLTYHYSIMCITGFRLYTEPMNAVGLYFHSDGIDDSVNIVNWLHAHLTRNPKHVSRPASSSSPSLHSFSLALSLHLSDASICLLHKLFKFDCCCRYYRCEQSLLMSIIMSHQIAQLHT